jgi:hypothetical protein
MAIRRAVHRYISMIDGQGFDGAGVGSAKLLLPSRVRSPDPKESGGFIDIDPRKALPAGTRTLMDLLFGKDDWITPPI